MWFRACAAFLVLSLAVAPRAAGEKPERWLEVRSPHFVVLTNSSEKQARRVAEQFELIRGVFKTLYPRARVDAAEPLVILAVKDEKSLRRLLPAFWEKKGSVHPAGLFTRGEEKHYVALQVNVSGDNPYHTIYHEYVHMLTSLNFRWMPLWVSEGYAEFFASAEIGEKDALIGRPSASQIRLLRARRRLPLEALFSADHASPFYTEENLASIFYAQAWVVTHYFLAGDRGAHQKTLLEYLAYLQTDVEEPEARRRALGDLKQLEEKIELYLRQFTFHAIRLEAPPEVEEADFAVREISPAEAAAVQGDFLLHTHRPIEARALLAEALRLDPHLALAHESLGFLHFQEGHREEAAQRFADTVRLNSRSYLANYYYAIFLLKDLTDEQAGEQVESALKRAIEINPHFAPAYSALAGYYSTQEENLEEALRLAQKAIELEPGVAAYHLNLGLVLLKLKRTEEAIRIGQRALATARSAEEQSFAESFVENARRYQEHLAAAKRATEQERKAREEWEETLAERRRRLEEEARKQPPPTAGTAESADGAQPMRAASEGRIVAVSCTPRALMKLTLALPAYQLELRATNHHRIEFLTAGWASPQPFDPCQHLKGLKARVTYTVGEPRAGEIVSIEISPQ